CRGPRRGLRDAARLAPRQPSVPFPGGHQPGRVRHRRAGRLPALHDLPVPLRAHLPDPARGRGGGHLPEPGAPPVTYLAGGSLMIAGESLETSWFLILGALLFTIGAVGILVRRNPLVILVCIELMLNAVNLTLITFSRQLQNLDGQLFALMSLTVAAAEAVIGLGILVDIFRLREVEDVDELSELKG